MAHSPSVQHSLSTIIERHRVSTDRTYRDLADETLIPLTTLHRRLNGDGFTLAEIDRLATVFGTTPSALMAEAEQSEVA